MYEGGISIETYGGQRAPEVHGYATPKYITSKIVVSRTILSALLLPQFYESIQINIFGFPYCSTCEDISIDVSITNVGLILTKLW